MPDSRGGDRRNVRWRLAEPKSFSCSRTVAQESEYDSCADLNSRTAGAGGRAGPKNLLVIEQVPPDGGAAEGCQFHDLFDGVAGPGQFADMVIPGGGPWQLRSARGGRLVPPVPLLDAQVTVQDADVDAGQLRRFERRNARRFVLAVLVRSRWFCGNPLPAAVTQVSSVPSAVRSQRGGLVAGVLRCLKGRGPADIGSSVGGRPVW